MFLHIPNVEEDTIIAIDTEYSEQNLIQFSAFVLERTAITDIFQLTSSVNWYVKSKKRISWFTTKYTGISDDFLNKNGLSRKAFITGIKTFFFKYNPNDTLLVGHAINNDILVLEKYGIKFNCKSDCTLELAKKVLERDKNLTLTDIAVEAGFSTDFAHDSYADALTTSLIYSFLKTINMEETTKNEIL